MSQRAAFDANKRLAEIALWADAAAGWAERAAREGRPSGRGGRATLDLDRAELDTFVAGLRGVARALLALAQPVPPPVAARRAGVGARLRLVSGEGGG